MEFNLEKIGNVAVVEPLMDALDAKNAKEFKQSISPILEDNQNVIFDMNRIKFLDSSGCGTILSCLRQLNSAGGDLKMYGLQSPVRTLFELIRMHRIIQIFNTKDEAVTSF